MAGVIQIVVTCTKRKRIPIPAELMMRNIDEGTVVERAKAWRERLRRPGECVPAQDLYAGDHWSVVRSLPTIGAGLGHRVKVWVCSAGYGLIPLTAKVRAYSATFAKNHPDTVCRVPELADRETPKAWWRRLSLWNGPERSQPRQLAQLAGAEPRGSIWVVASEIYLDAIADDLQSLARELDDPDKLSIFSAGTEALPNLTSHLVPLDARLQNLVGGALRSLNIRAARLALEKMGNERTTLSCLQDWFRRKLRIQPDQVAWNRTPMTDEAIKMYIRKKLTINRDSRYSPLLRQLRDLGFACEYRRFSSLYRQVVEQIHEGR